MKRFATLLIAAAASAHAQFAVMHTNGVVTSPTNLTIQQSNVAGLSSALNGKLATNGSAEGLTNFPSNLLRYGANGQVSYANTNPLTFTNRFRQSSDNATNPPEIRLVTKSNNVASWFAYDAANVSTNTNNAHWATQWFALNEVPAASGNDRTTVNSSIGAASFTLENMYFADYQPNPGHVAEFYFNVTSYVTNATTRAFFVGGSQTNSRIGIAGFEYPLQINYDSNSRYWNGGDNLGLTVSSTNSGALARFLYNGTNTAEVVEVLYQVQENATSMQAGRETFQIFPYGAGRGIKITTNGVLLGHTALQNNPSSVVHLAGNTRIDGAVSFNNTSSAASSRTNLGLGGGITTNVSGGTLQFSNGVLVGHTP